MTKKRIHPANKENADINKRNTDLPTVKRHCRKNAVVDSTFKTQNSVSRNQERNLVILDDDSPPNLFIDTIIEACSSQVITVDNDSQIESVQECLSVPEDINQSNNERLLTENRTSATNRPIQSQTPSITRTPLSASRIVVSVDRRQRESSENITYNRISNTPIQPRQQQSRNNTTNNTNNSYSVDLIPRETYDILTRFSEFRQLVKAFNDEKKKCLNWANYYARLQEEYNQLKANSFRNESFRFSLSARSFILFLARPPAPALNYLVDLVTVIQHSSGRDDPRTDEQLARDLGESANFLDGLKDVSPQQTAVNLFNYLYPGCEPKVQLESIKKFEKDNPGLLRTTLTFAQRSSPGTNYKMQDLSDTLGNSIRGARFLWKKLQSSVAYQANLLTSSNCDQQELEEEYGHDENNESSNNTNTRHSRETDDGNDVI